MSVPRIIFQTWKVRSPIPEKWQKGFDAWDEFCKKYGYTHVLWSDEDNRAFIAKEYPWFLAKYDSYKYPIMRADAVRPFFLLHYGGCYSDLDLWPKPDKFEEVHDLIQSYGSRTTAAVPITKNKFWKDTLTNSFIVAQKGSQFMRCVIDSLQDPGKYHWTPLKHVLAQTHKFHIIFMSGPGIFSDQSLLHPDIVTYIPERLISDPTHAECLMVHERGASWHDPKQMQQDILRLVMIGIAVVFFIIVFIWVIGCMLR